jgi:hypothetical protein
MWTESRTVTSLSQIANALNLRSHAPTLNQPALLAFHATPTFFFPYISPPLSHGLSISSAVQQEPRFFFASLLFSL